MEPEPLGFSARFWAHFASISLLSWGEGWGARNTFSRCGICCWDWGGSPPGGEQSPVEQMGSDRGLCVSCRMFRNVLPWCWAILLKLAQLGRSLASSSRWRWWEIYLNLEKQGQLLVLQTMSTEPSFPMQAVGLWLEGQLAQVLRQMFLSVP